MTGALVTGAGGFVGANLVRRLAADGHDVVAAVRPGTDDYRLAGLDIRVEDLDLLDLDATYALVTELRPRWIFHLAAHGAYSWQTDAEEMIAVNVLACRRLLDAAHAVDAAFVNAGSSSEYGVKAVPPAEAAALEPNSDYAVTKAAATHFCSIAPARAMTLRLYSAYGPWEDRRRLIPQLVEHALAGALPPLVSPDIARDFVFVGDVCDAFVRAAQALDAGATRRILNVGSGAQVSLGELVETVRGLWNVRAQPEWGSMEERIWDTSTWQADPSLARTTLDWHAVTALREGLLATAAWLNDEVDS